MMTDPIADLLTRIRNAQATRKATVEIPASKVKKAIAEVLVREGYLASVEQTTETPTMLEVGLKYNGKKPYIQSLKRESTPGHRMYRKADELPTILNGYGIAIVSTSKGLMTDKEARLASIGGEVICSVY